MEGIAVFELSVGAFNVVVAVLCSERVSSYASTLTLLAMILSID